uniref:ATP synthase subunit d, mitochondrial n=1 Tax=Eucampia antarctica TaxID=49252 RepID=A0A7S2R087_9STRA|mmetsp:Transcript_11483/g.11006  ORF Transcript_11483/g.11006 Transcript_11483/m.11006 type:complete len:170 (+) Transcript_11483:67-576(+)|eukprot:CAMPEP_0197823016 /NCGR_PEP_ID=MMETSP1437-20131217/339_1 /TAXON_ID=49252 ORGANISM="Eucampia antarctica, Strain CCMP1452" /NCGR_SAMPLE_ID=MMETSP1437 /ASSEMBLY_ACC=CAM_ASM_001096 /LENGTH=169 /DNA_ID=CAMNT_0043421951 /DNA_START=41 /DNA_END=550 /DNA_ORIENTATION=-
MSLTVRNVVRRLAHRNINWSSPLFKGDPEVASATVAFRSWAASADAMAEKYSAAPATIDFASAKSAVRDSALVETLENLYNTNTPPAEVYEWSVEDKADKAQQIEDAKGRLAFTQEMIDESEKELAFMKSTKTTRDTSASDLKQNYPDLAEEIEKEIENREWFKDTLSK